MYIASSVGGDHFIALVLSALVDIVIVSLGHSDLVRLRHVGGCNPVLK